MCLRACLQGVHIFFTTVVTLRLLCTQLKYTSEQGKSVDCYCNSDILNLAELRSYFCVFILCREKLAVGFN